MSEAGKYICMQRPICPYSDLDACREGDEEVIRVFCDDFFEQEEEELENE